MQTGAGQRAEVLAPDAAGIARAAQILRAGGLVAFPTETVYGLGGDATNEDASAAIYAAKGRPSFNPLIAHIAAPEDAATWAIMPEAAQRLAARFWPGPLTLVLPLKAPAGSPGGICARVAPGGKTVALRCPAHPVARDLLRAVGRPVAGPSANPSGGVSPTSAAHVLAGLGTRIDAVLDAGPCIVGVESTIVACDADGGIRLLRPGGVTAEALAAMFPGALRDAHGAPLVLGQAPEAALSEAAPEAPGMLASHYAPGALVRLNADGPRPGEGWLGFGPDPDALAAHDGPRLNLSPGADPAEAAATLFAALRDLDHALGGQGGIAVAPIPETGLGRAVNDRLRRAAAPRGDLNVRA